MKINQQDATETLQNAYIEGPSTGNANLWLDGLNIKNSTDKSTVRFQGSGNVLTLKGTNKIATENPVATDPWKKAVINVGKGAVIQSNSGGALDMVVDRTGLNSSAHEESNQSGIGLDEGETDANVDVTLYNANISMKGVGSRGNYSTMVGAAPDGEMGNVIVYGGNITIDTRIGTGIGTGGPISKINDIIINGGANVNVVSAQGAAIGSGAAPLGASEVNNIYIDNATVYACAREHAAAIGSGTGFESKVNEIYIGNNAHIIAEALTAESADIGAGHLSTVNNVIIGKLAYVDADVIGKSSTSTSTVDNTGKLNGSVTYQDLNLNHTVNPPNVIEPDSGTTTTTETVTHTQTTGGIQGDPLIIHHGPKANQALHCYINDMHTDAMGLSGTKVVTREDAQWALSDDSTDPPRIGAIDQAINYALNEATTVGAYISRLETTEDNLVISSENAQSSESTIRDADMAKEMAEFTKNNVLAQASQSMLAQANQNSSSVLSLLQ